MSKTFDELMKVLEDKGTVPEEEATKIIKEHGALSDEEKHQVAAAIRMKKSLSAAIAHDLDKPKEKPAEEKKEADKKDGDTKPADKKEDDKKKESEEVTLEDYMSALSVMDSEDASKEDKEKAQKIKDKFESQ